MTDTKRNREIHKLGGIYARLLEPARQDIDNTYQKVERGRVISLEQEVLPYMQRELTSPLKTPDMLQKMPLEKVADLLNIMRPEAAVRIVSHMAVEKAVAVIENIGVQAVTRLFAHIGLKDAVHLVRSMEPDVAAAILEKIPSKNAAELLSEIVEIRGYA